MTRGLIKGFILTVIYYGLATLVVIIVAQNVDPSPLHGPGQSAFVALLFLAIGVGTFCKNIIRISEEKNLDSNKGQLYGHLLAGVIVTLLIMSQIS